MPGRTPGGSLWPAGAGALAIAASFTGGCSVFFHEDASQCASDHDCTARGAAFANTACDLPTRTCTASASSSSDGGTDPDAPAADAADAGPPCTTADDCKSIIPVGSVHREVTCSPDTLRCIQLTNDTCPYVFGDYTYPKNIPPIMVGAFATLPPSSPMDHPSYRNYQLAIQEFTNYGGIPAGPGGALRMPVAVVCNDDVTQTDAAMDHLVNDVHVPAVIPALDSADLRALFNSYGYNTPPGLFVINPFGFDSTLNTVHRGEQLWHLLGAPTDLASAYRALFPRLESYLRNKTPLGPTNPMRVATVTAGGAVVLSDLAGAVVTQPITWNNGNGQFTSTPTAYYHPETLSSSTLSGTPLNKIDLSAVVADLLQFKPHIIVSFASEEFVALLRTLELQWSTSGPASPPPFYVLGPYNADSTALLQWVNGDSQKQSRLVGINFASTTATSVLDGYESRFTAAGNPLSALGSENYYDAMYLAVDALVGATTIAGHPGPLTGSDVGAGMLRLISVAGAPHSVGPADMTGVFTALASTTASISLTGALGPPLFNTDTGARVSQGDVYCVTVQPASDAGPATTVFTADVLRLSPSTDGGAPVLAGDASCAPGL